MTAVAETLHSYTQQVRNNRLGLWLFFISEAFLFAGLLVVRFYLWGNTRPEMDQFIGLIITSVLLVSSFSMNIAETAIEHGDRKTFLRALVTTGVLGTIFLVGVMVFEWGLFPSLVEGHLSPVRRRVRRCRVRDDGHARPARDKRHHLHRHCVEPGPQGAASPKSKIGAWSRAPSTGTTLTWCGSSSTRRYT